MSVFSSNRNSESEPIARIGHAAQLSILAQGTRFVGEIECDGVIKIEGRLEGVVRAQEQVLVAPGGTIMGDVRGGEVVVAGRVEGDVTATGRVELRPGGVVHGDVTAPRIVVQEGGEVNGRVRTEKPAAARTVTSDQLKKTA